MTTEEKYKKLKIFMREHRITWPALGEKLGVTAQGAAALCRRAVCKPDYYNELVRLGFPKEIIPEPNLPIFPGLQQGDGCQQKSNHTC